MGTLPCLFKVEEGVTGVLVVRVGEMAMERSAGFMAGEESYRRTLMDASGVASDARRC